MIFSWKVQTKKGNESTKKTQPFFLCLSILFFSFLLFFLAKVWAWQMLKTFDKWLLSSGWEAIFDWIGQNRVGAHFSLIEAQLCENSILSSFFFAIWWLGQERERKKEGHFAKHQSSWLKVSTWLAYLTKVDRHAMAVNQSSENSQSMKINDARHGLLKHTHTHTLTSVLDTMFKGCRQSFGISFRLLKAYFSLIPRPKPHLNKWTGFSFSLSL